ncbi:hypothetical protein [Thioalkalivibrio sp. HK1]|uniref:hypothetical protein n=1 Tax=Thioalkalivibrio sp. HK1 TaxID=1469245 RepID=UPI0012DD125E|nr:hypothetical protein [Thioalkalivibrio sp. HK1]
MKTNPFMARYAETDKHASGPTASSCLALHPLAARFLEKSPLSIARLVLIGLFIATGPAAAQPVEPAHECIGFFDEHLTDDDLVYFAGPEGIVGSDDNYSKGLECREIIKPGSTEEIVLYRLVGTPNDCDPLDALRNTKMNIDKNSNTITSDMTSIGLVWCAEYDDDDLQWRSGYKKCELDRFGGLDASCEPIGTIVNRQEKIEAGSIVVSRTVNGQAINISSIDITESNTSTFMVHLDSNPTVDVTLSITTDIPNSDVVVSPSTLTFTSGGRTDSGGNYGTGQEITITPMMDNIVDPEVTGTIILTPTGGSNYDGTQRRLSLTIGDDDDSGLKITSGGAPVGNRTIISDRGQDIVFEATISSNPSSPFSVSLSHTLSDSIRFIPSTINFSSSNWQSPQTFTLSVPDEADKEAETGNIIVKAIGAPSEYSNIDRTIPIIISTGDGSGGGGGDKPTDPNDPKTWVVQTYALAIPPVTAQDQAIVRLRCLQDDQCPVYLDCQAQTDGTKFEGRMGAPIPAWGSTTLNARDIVDITGGSWENKGRLSCSIRSHSKVAALVWTRSGDGVLVNNSAAIMSREIRNAAGGSYFQAEIASIPSPLSADGSNIRILCAATGGRSCSETSVSCFDDEGVRRDGNLGIIERNTVHHLQTQALAEIIAYQWQQGSLMSCEMRSDQPFSVQILTRTGGGGALVNNSASGG